MYLILDFIITERPEWTYVILEASGLLFVMFDDDYKDVDDFMDRLLENHKEKYNL